MLPKNNDEGRAIYGNLENKINTLYSPVENSIPKKEPQFAKIHQQYRQSTNNPPTIQTTMLRKLNAATFINISVFSWRSVLLFMIL
jgi:hypothetical protein